MTRKEVEPSVRRAVVRWDPTSLTCRGGWSARHRRWWWSCRHHVLDLSSTRSERTSMWYGRATAGGIAVREVTTSCRVTTTAEHVAAFNHSSSLDPRACASASAQDWLYVSEAMRELVQSSVHLGGKVQEKTRVRQRLGVGIFVQWHSSFLECEGGVTSNSSHRDPSSTRA